MSERTVEAEANTNRVGGERVGALLSLIHCRMELYLIVVVRFGTEYTAAGCSLLTLVWEVVPPSVFSKQRHTAKLGCTMRMKAGRVSTLAKQNVVFQQVAAMTRLFTSVILIRSLWSFSNLKKSGHTFASRSQGRC